MTLRTGTGYFFNEAWFKFSMIAQRQKSAYSCSTENLVVGPEFSKVSVAIVFSAKIKRMTNSWLLRQQYFNEKVKILKHKAA